MAADRSERILVIGGGAREHAIAMALARSSRVERVYVAPGNGGLEHEALTDPKVERVADATLEPDALVSLAGRLAATLTVVGPEGPLAAGVVDRFHAAHRRIFGPTHYAAEIETSKAYAKSFMQRHRIPTARGAAYDDYHDAKAALAALGAPVVVKASGLAAGKGVFVCDTMYDAEHALWRLMEAGELGAAGREVVIEECLHGREVSLMALCDGNRLKRLPPARDHKRLGDGDEGPNTGGMGAFCPVADVDEDLQDEIERTILRPALVGLRAEGRPFVGVLYAGCMVTPDGPKCLEFNARFGDPETQVVLPLLDTDLVDVFDACIDGRLDDIELSWRDGAAVGVVVAAPGYPGQVVRGVPVGGLAEARASAEIYTAGLARHASGFASSGGRVLTLVGRGPDLSHAREAAYRALDDIALEGMQVRRDIGLPPSAYAAAGVDIAAANAAVRGMKRAVEATHTPHVLSNLGGFGGLFDTAAFAHMSHPVLVASTDGVGTKTMLARQLNRWDTIGRDLVAHSVNDILVMGARPLFFLDYIASGRLDPKVVITVVTGLAEACRELGVALIGGETAEMPGVYQRGEVDLAGTIVGVVEKGEILDGGAIAVGDVVCGLASTGLHTNGYSLARRVLAGLSLDAAPPGFRVPLGDALMAPHRCYLREVVALWEEGIKPVGLVHVTGGGFIDNPPRILRPELACSLDLRAWERPALFRLIQERGGIGEREMAKVTNLGIGLMIVLHPDDVARARAILPELITFGTIGERPDGAPQVLISK